MEFSHWLMFSAVAAINIFSPGPAVLLAISNSVSFGVRRVVVSSLGNATGLFLLSSLTMVGLGALLKSSSTLFATLKIVGAMYLIFLGIRQWRAKGNVFSQRGSDASTPQRSDRKLYSEGMTLALTNPKAILFFTALFPQFMDNSRAIIPQFLILTGTFMVISFCSLMMYGVLARSTTGWFSIERHSRWFNRVTGGLFVMLGAGLMQLKNVRS